MEIDLVLDDIERLVRNIRTFTSVLKDMQNICDNMDPLKPSILEKKKKSKKTQTEPLAELKPVEAEVPEALVCEPIKKKKMRKPKLERS
jgi:hypothetical protein